MSLVEQNLYAPKAAPERQAQAIAEVQKMHDDFSACKEECDQLKADLNRSEDRLTMVIDERNRLRRELKIYQEKLIELATAMSNIGLLTNTAQSVMASAQELLDNVDGGSEDRKTSMEKALANLDKDLDGSQH